VALSDTAGVEPTVLEVELIPGEKLCSPRPGVPWADRMEEYLLHEKELKQLPQRMAMTVMMMMMTMTTWTLTMMSTAWILISSTSV